MPPKDQQEFEDLVRAAAAPLSTAAQTSSSSVDAAQPIHKGDELHPDARRGPRPDFEGDVNPVTGEVGGPKNEPLKHGDWSFGGRVTDF